MLVELKKLRIINDGYKRRLSLNKIYVNPSHVISIVDYDGVNRFLLNEGSDEYSTESFSLIKMNNIGGVEEVIVLGSSQEVFQSFNIKSKQKEILNG